MRNSRPADDERWVRLAFKVSAIVTKCKLILGMGKLFQIYNEFSKVFKMGQMIKL